MNKIIFLIAFSSGLLSSKRNPFCPHTKDISKPSPSCQEYKLLAVGIMEKRGIAVATIKTPQGIALFKRGDKIGKNTITSITDRCVTYRTRSGLEKKIMP